LLKGSKATAMVALTWSLKLEVCDGALNHQRQKFLEPNEFRPPTSQEQLGAQMLDFVLGQTL